jgi:hypothetical protein
MKAAYKWSNSQKPNEEPSGITPNRLSPRQRKLVLQSEKTSAAKRTLKISLHSRQQLNKVDHIQAIQKTASIPKMTFEKDIFR